MLTVFFKFIGEIILIYIRKKGCILKTVPKLQVCTPAELKKLDMVDHTYKYRKQEFEAIELGQNHK